MGTRKNLTAKSPKGKFILMIAGGLDPFAGYEDDLRLDTKKSAVADARECITDFAADGKTKKDLTKGVKIFRITAVEEVNLSTQITKAVTAAAEERAEEAADPWNTKIERVLD